MVEEAALQLGVQPPVSGALAAASSWLNASVASGRFRDAPRPGRVGVILPDGSDSGHVVLIANVLEGGKVATREGNTLDVLGARYRPTSAFRGFVELEPEARS
jgi:hypothetical protein